MRANLPSQAAGKSCPKCGSLLAHKSATQLLECTVDMAQTVLHRRCTCTARHAGRELEFYGLPEDIQRLGQGAHEKGQDHGNQSKESRQSCSRAGQHYSGQVLSRLQQALRGQGVAFSTHFHWWQGYGADHMSLRIPWGKHSLLTQMKPAFISRARTAREGTHKLWLLSVVHFYAFPSSGLG